MSKTKQVTNASHSFFRMVSSISYSGFTELAPTLTPLAPAFFFGFAIGTAVYDKTGSSLAAALVGIAAAAGLESAGFMAFHSAMHTYRRYGWKAALLPVLYLVIGIVSLWTVEGTTSPETAIIGTALFLLAACVYAARMLVKEASKNAVTIAQETAVERQLAIEERRWKRQQDQLTLQQQHDLKLKQAELSAQIKVEKLRTHSGTNTDTYKADWRTLSDTEKLRLLDLTPEEIVNRYGVSSKTAARWLNRAEQLSGKLSTNGHAK